MEREEERQRFERTKAYYESLENKDDTPTDWFASWESFKELMRDSPPDGPPSEDGDA